uniref:Uncharacterized protein n=1 Tax=Arundo donax TaxID=35708 RepID=A0A0A9AUI1_ARUDO
MFNSLKYLSIIRGENHPEKITKPSSEHRI